MAFGRRRAVVRVPPTTTTAPTYTTGPATRVPARRRRGWNNMGYRKRGAASTIAANKVVGGSGTKMTDAGAARKRKMSVASAKIGEKFARLGADLKLGLYTVSHPFHPLQRTVAREQNINLKAVAAERRRQKIARALDVEMRRRAAAREMRAARLQTAL